jgi:thioredoxin-related protein
MNRKLLIILVILSLLLTACGKDYTGIVVGKNQNRWNLDMKDSNGVIHVVDTSMEEYYSYNIGDSISVHCNPVCKIK